MNASACWNILPISVTPETFHASSGWLKLFAASNMPHISFTPEVSHELIS